MSRVSLAACVTFAVVTASALPAEAAHRRCRTCPGGYSSGGWFHYRSGGGMYVPFSSPTQYASHETVVHGPAWPSPQPYWPAHGQPIRYSQPGCVGCMPR